jgi:hypothetical protein
MSGENTAMSNKDHSGGRRGVLKAYKEYKNTHYDWLPQIPAHWEVGGLKTLGIAKNGLTFAVKDLSDDGILVLCSSNIKNNQLSFE